MIQSNGQVVLSIMKDGTAAFSLYEEWVIEPDLQFKSKLAAQIRDLPVRDGVECE